MSKPSTHWRITFAVKIKRSDRLVEFKKHATAVPGTRAQAVKHLRVVLEKIWPSASLRLVRAIPDREAEARAAKEALSA